MGPVCKAKPQPSIDFTLSGAPLGLIFGLYDSNPHQQRHKPGMPGWGIHLGFATNLSQIRIVVRTLGAIEIGEGAESSWSRVDFIPSFASLTRTRTNRGTKPVWLGYLSGRRTSPNLARSA